LQLVLVTEGKFELACDLGPEFAEDVEAHVGGDVDAHALGRWTDALGATDKSGAPQE